MSYHTNRPIVDPDGPSVEQLYDDPADTGTGVDVGKLYTWLTEHRPGWEGRHPLGTPKIELQIVAEVLDALHAVGDATLLKNATYRALRRDVAAVERLNAWLQNHGEYAAILDKDGDAVEAAIGLLSGMLRPDRQG